MMTFFVSIWILSLIAIVLAAVAYMATKTTELFVRCMAILDCAYEWLEELHGIYTNSAETGAEIEVETENADKAALP